jgi:hypothetical protein
MWFKTTTTKLLWNNTKYLINLASQTLRISAVPSLTFFGMEPHNGRISKLDVLTTIPSGNASLPGGLQRF